jgi:hypothetical protein
MMGSHSALASTSGNCEKEYDKDRGGAGSSNYEFRGDAKIDLNHARYFASE